MLVQAMEEGYTGVRLAEREEEDLDRALPPYVSWMPQETGLRDFAPTEWVQADVQQPGPSTRARARGGRGLTFLVLALPHASCLFELPIATTFSVLH